MSGSIFLFKLYLPRHTFSKKKISSLISGFITSVHTTQPQFCVSVTNDLLWHTNVKSHLSEHTFYFFYVTHTRTHPKKKDCIKRKIYFIFLRMGCLIQLLLFFRHLFPHKMFATGNQWNELKRSEKYILSSIYSNWYKTILFNVNLSVFLFSWDKISVKVCPIS